MRWLAALKAWEQWTKQAEARLTRELQDLFSGAMEATVEELLSRGYVPKDDAAIQALLKEFVALKEPFGHTISQAAVEAAGVGRLHIFTELARMGVEMNFSEFSPMVNGLLMTYAFTASQRTMDRLIGDVMGNLAESYRMGLGIDEAAERLRNSFRDMRDWELRRIACTEVNAHQNLGAFRTERELGIVYHQWWAAMDERVRVSHAEHHGQIVRVGDPFSNGLLFPGDRDSGPIEEWVNCRCRVVPFLMPEGYTAPSGKRYFYESELVPISVEEEEPDLLSEEYAQALREKLKAITGPDRYRDRLKLLNEELDKAIQKKLAEKGAVTYLLPWYEDPALDFLQDEVLLSKIVNFAHLGELDKKTIALRLNSAAQWLRRHVHPDVLAKAGGIREIEFIGFDGRSSYFLQGRSIQWSGAKAYTFIHEYGHHLHYNGGADLERMVQEFMKSRITKKSKLTPVHGKKDELGYKDKFVSHYVGRVYPWEDPANPYGTEVVSMGLHWMGTDPGGLYQRDPGHFRLIYAIMRGILL